MKSKFSKRPPPPRSMKIARVDRVRFLGIAFTIVSILVSIRLFHVQVLQHAFYAALASDQHEIFKQLTPKRGEIFVKDTYSETGVSVIATNQTTFQMYANPKQVNDAVKAAEVLAPLLNIESEVLLARLQKKDDVYEPLKHKVPEQERDAVTAALTEHELKGIYALPEDSRTYPEGPITAALTGFLGIVDDEPRGQYGLEEYFQDQLAGRVGSLASELDPSGRYIATGDHSIVKAQDGDTLILTIDKNIQYKSCTLLEEAVKKHGAKQGSLVVMDPATGAILALCNAPSFDPNNYSQVENIEQFINDAIADQYEPGSVFKSITMSAALNEGKVKPQTTYDDVGQVRIGAYTIRNSDGKAQGVVDMTKVLELSLNTGAIFAVQQIGNDRWNDYVEAYGFGKRTEIELSGENNGNIGVLAQGKDIYSATSSYGQGITVTPMQLVQAYGAIANEGAMMKPYLIDRVVKSNGYQEVMKPEEVGRPISAETARTLGAMLVRVIDFGHAQRAQVPGYFMAGKTGTAQIPRTDGAGYDPHRHKDTFMGFGPVSDPKFVVLVKIDEPNDVQWAEGSVVPVFGDLARFLVNYLKIPPDRK